MAWRLHQSRRPARAACRRPPDPAATGPRTPGRASSPDCGACARDRPAAGPPVAWSCPAGSRPGWWNPAGSRAPPRNARCRARATAPRLRRPPARWTRTTRARPQICSQVTGLRLCGMAELPFWPAREILFGLAHFGALQVAHFERDLLAQRRDQRQRGDEMRVPVALDHLRSHRRGLQVQPRADPLLHFRADVRERAHRARNLAHAQIFRRRAAAAPGCGPLPRTRWRASGRT